MVGATYNHQSLERIIDEDVKTLLGNLTPGTLGFVGC